MRTTMLNGAPLIIEWERGDHQESHDYTRVYNCYGTGEDGKEYIGNWNDYGGDVEITDIEEA